MADYGLSLDEHLKARQMQFGLDYIALIEKRASPNALKWCLRRCMEDLAKIRKVYDHDDPSVNGRHIPNGDAPSLAPSMNTRSIISEAETEEPQYDESVFSVISGDADYLEEQPHYDESARFNPEADHFDDEASYAKDRMRDSEYAGAAAASAAAVATAAAVAKHREYDTEPSDEEEYDDEASASIDSDSESGSRSGTSESETNIDESETTDNVEESEMTNHNEESALVPAEPEGPRVIKRNKANKIAKSAGRRRQIKDCFRAGNEDNPFENANPYQWRLNELRFNGKTRAESKGKVETIQGKSIKDGIEHFKANPDDYVAMLYQTSQLTEKWPTSQCEYILVHREGTKLFQPLNVSEKGWMTIFLQEYEALPSFENDLLPEKYRDKYTDRMTYKGHRLHSDSNPPILPGRGMGVCDAPNIKIIGDVDPSDIHQGNIGDCWLLSGISSLAEFDGAIKHLFRKTPGLERMPHEKPNKYVVTYWDLETWKEVDIEIDERLAVAKNGGLLAAKPSADGELWVCYLEKAFAIHAGGWDKIVGGQCSHAWAVMTGCKYQYIITETKPGSRRWHCALRYKESEDLWGKHANSPHDCDGLYYKARWPDVGGGGGKADISEEELFEKMCAWDDANFIMGAGTTGESDENTTGGMVDNHAYSVIECHNDVAGTPIDLIKVRNPWGKGEIEDGQFDDDGPGWDEWPEVKDELNPVVADDGIFYVTPEEFFRFFGTIFLSASDMTEFLED